MIPAEIQLLVSEYVGAAKSYGEALGKGDHRAANKAHDVLTNVFRKLGKLGSDAEVLALLADETPSVRYSAAVHALGIAPQRGESVLEAIVNGPPSPLRLMAQISLCEWRKLSSACDFYSSARLGITGSSSQTVRQWLGTQSLESQAAFGQRVMENLALTTLASSHSRVDALSGNG